MEVSPKHAKQVDLMIYDCFPFFNELELLELRRHELADVVDKFVLVEATRTHTNQEKPLYFQENRARFAAFNDKIVHVIVRDLPQVSDPWIPDRFQRNCIARGLVNCRPDDWVLISDADEIPRASVVDTISRETPFDDSVLANAVHGALNSRPLQAILQRKGIRRQWRKMRPFVWKFQQSLYVYFLNCRSSNLWPGTSMVRFRDFSCAEEIRYSERKIVPAAGWHFCWMGGADRIRQKSAATAHQEVSPAQQLEHVRNVIAGAGQGVEFVTLDDSFPQYLRENTETFSSWLRSA